MTSGCFSVSAISTILSTHTIDEETARLNSLGSGKFGTPSLSSGHHKLPD